MNVKLPPEQQKWLEAEVAAGSFSSIDEALAVAVADLMAITTTISLGLGPTLIRLGPRLRAEMCCRVRSFSNASTPSLRRFAPNDAFGRHAGCGMGHRRNNIIPRT
jgi:hypothetical protein